MTGPILAGLVMCAVQLYLANSVYKKHRQGWCIFYKDLNAGDEDLPEIWECSILQRECPKWWMSCPLHKL